jgi:hypothetical protein
MEIGPFFSDKFGITSVKKRKLASNIRMYSIDCLYADNDSGRKKQAVRTLLKISPTGRSKSTLCGK